MNTDFRRLLYKFLDYSLYALITFIVIYLSTLYAINEYMFILDDLGYIKFPFVNEVTQ